ncbi:50S ribosomal protein L23 [Rubeoparvulum massiliense]|uniref:50S ribosomal protein L23 n=1 Tax=Rubeoparvulum massiliense TaxID=1631346 RepID=UPI00065E2EA2|nr:50S ribosomal protein L23 [Rubeoparvulum massiliense]
MQNARDILKRPIITERTADMMAEKKYVFEVDIKANKTAIKQAVEHIFGVKVISVNTVRVKGKPKRYGRFEGYRPDRKKAYVQLAADSKELEFFETV